MGILNCNQASLESIIVRAQTDLISPYIFYKLCQEFCLKTGTDKLYFGEPISCCLDFDRGLGIAEIRTFLDGLAFYIRLINTPNSTVNFWLSCRDKELKKPINITVKVIGCGVVGRVAKIIIDGANPVAFKTFFDPDFVWIHGPWGEIPVGIRLKYCGVTRDMAEFLFAGTSWVVSEWIDYEQSKLCNREGLTYQEFAKKEGLTKLNPLNRNNYNLNGIRLDPGGIQKDYLGRRWVDFYRGIWFYMRKIRRDKWRGIYAIAHQFLRGIILTFRRLIQKPGF
ncbi:hypothetical protein K4A83_01430 [Spirulina subsalsa FACHB-351]|uniref:Uncharacterized protein n=1 Tax=Spirulina subsalsa FACHB-351 TaxID=234711 RepID=A0ABT3L0C5_9CYAN|nr:hypothetical protein [Spirulina subsalsa]MCW6034936.1 hypothetical protein [Spirulina subsalsa FACHB-351]